MVQREWEAGTWKPGQGELLNYEDTVTGGKVVIHYERYFAKDGSGRYVVVCWDDFGNIAFGAVL
jgi:hypothetical protein